MADAFRGLTAGGVFIGIEPGVGHAISEPTRDVVAKFGTTEKDMPYAHQAKLLHAVGQSQQWAHVRALTEGTRNGLTSVVV